MNVNEDTLREGVAEASCYWLSQHDISFPDLCEDAITEAFNRWLDNNRELIISRFTEVLREECRSELLRRIQH
jgi:hypothetical protein